MGIVHDAFLWHLQTEQEDNDRAWQEAHRHHLAVSDLGHCVRKAYLRLRKSQETHRHDDYVLGIMRDGNMHQDDTARALAAWYGGQVHWDKNDPALCVGDDKWSGHLDLPIHAPTGDLIVEHKATNPDNFCKRNRLPYPFHCPWRSLQVVGSAYRAQADAVHQASEITMGACTPESAYEPGARHRYLRRPGKAV